VSRLRAPDQRRTGTLRRAFRPSRSEDHEFPSAWTDEITSCPEYKVTAVSVLASLSVKAKPRVLVEGCSPSMAIAIGQRSPAGAVQPRGTATTGCRVMLETVLAVCPNGMCPLSELHAGGAAYLLTGLRVTSLESSRDVQS
jgi:hypothetical protein